VVQFGALLAVLPVAAALLTINPRSGLRLHRELSARELPTDEVLDVTVSVRGRMPRGRSLLLEDLAPRELGGAHRFALTGMSGEGLTRSHYQLRVGARGIHHLGPIRIHVIDRFGMVHRVINAGGRDEVIVHPRVVALDAFVLSGASVGSGSGHLGARGAATDDVIPREYRSGDEMRRVDWKASARTGSLMVRSEENPWRSAVTLIVDLKVGAHRGIEPDSSADAALSLTASIGALALANGWDLTVRTSDDLELFSGSPITGVAIEKRQLLLALATVPLSHAAVPAPSLGQSARAAGTGPLILITGKVGIPTARLLAGIGTYNPTRFLVAVAADQWATESTAPARPVGSSDALQWFDHAGWLVTRMQRPAHPGPADLARAVQDAWAGLAVRR
jgi:uncharacterized protein (DUF58 family)